MDNAERIERLQGQLANRDARIHDLEQRLASELKSYKDMIGDLAVSEADAHDRAHAAEKRASTAEALLARVVECRASALTHVPGLLGEIREVLAPDSALPDEPIDDLIARSSLGTPEAVAIREQTDPEHAARIVARAEELSALPDEPPTPSGAQVTLRDVLEHEMDCEEERADYEKASAPGNELRDLVAKAQAVEHEHEWHAIDDIPEHLRGGPDQICYRCGGVRETPAPEKP
jgi:hypothetical protein